MARFALLFVLSIATISSEAAVVTVKLPPLGYDQRAVTKYGRPVWSAIKRCAGTDYNPYVEDNLYYCALPYMRRSVRDCLARRGIGPIAFGQCYDKQHTEDGYVSPPYFYLFCFRLNACLQD